VSQGLTTANQAITLTASNGVTLSGATADITTGGGSLIIDSDSDNNGAGAFASNNAGSAIVTSNGVVTITAADVVTSGTINSGSGATSFIPSTANGTAVTNDAVSHWQFVNGTDLNGGQSNVTAGGANASFNVDVSGTGINAANSDGRALTEGTAPSFLDQSPSSAEMIAAAGGSLTTFARVRMNSFNGIDDIWRVGKDSSAASGLGLGGQDTYALEFDAGKARFVVSEDGQVDGSEAETIVTHGTTLTANQWYDIVGVFSGRSRYGQRSGARCDHSLRLQRIDRRAGRNGCVAGRRFRYPRNRLDWQWPNDQHTVPGCAGRRERPERRRANRAGRVVEPRFDGNRHCTSH
jgi:hypothetical protein